MSSADPSPVEPTPAETAEDWNAARLRVAELVETADALALTRSVPATPSWSVLNLLSHVIGLDADVLDGAEADDHNPTWTQAHVEARAQRTASELLAEWDGLAESMTTYLRETDTRPLMDLIIHEQDLRGALERPGARETRGWSTTRASITARLGDALGELAPLRLESDTWTWQSGDGEPGATLRADAFDLARAVMSRRTAQQLRSWVVAGDIEPYLVALSALGALPDEPLPE